MRHPCSSIHTPLPCAHPSPTPLVPPSLLCSSLCQLFNCCTTPPRCSSSSSASSCSCSAATSANRSSSPSTNRSPHLHPTPSNSRLHRPASATRSTTPTTPSSSSTEPRSGRFQSGRRDRARAGGSVIAWLRLTWRSSALRWRSPVVGWGGLGRGSCPGGVGWVGCAARRWRRTWTGGR